MFSSNNNLFPTPEWLVKKILSKVDFSNFISYNMRLLKL